MFQDFPQFGKERLASRYPIVFYILDEAHNLIKLIIIQCHLNNYLERP